MYTKDCRIPPTQNVRLGFVEVTDWVHTHCSETSYSHYPVIAAMISSLSNYSMGSCFMSPTQTDTHSEKSLNALPWLLLS